MLTEEDVVSDMPIAQSIALKIWHGLPLSASIELNEVVGVAYEGLVMAAARYPSYCEENGFEVDSASFRNYARKKIYGHVIDYFRAMAISTRKERALYKRLVAAGLCDGATEKELAARTQTSIKDIRATLKWTSTFLVSYDSELPDDLFSAPRFQIIGPQDVEREIRERLLCAVVVKTIAKLPKLQQVILALHYVEGLELQEAAVAVSIPVYQASKEHTEAVLIVRQALADALITDFTS